MKIINKDGNEVFRSFSALAVWEEFHEKYNTLNFRVVSLNW